MNFYKKSLHKDNSQGNIYPSIINYIPLMK